MQRRTKAEEDVKQGTTENRIVGTATGERFILRPSCRPPRKEQPSDSPRNSSCLWEGIIPSFLGARRRRKQGESPHPFNFLGQLPATFVPRRRRQKQAYNNGLHLSEFRARALYFCDSLLLLSREKHFFGIIVILSLAIIALSLIQKMIIPILEAYTNYRASLFAPFRFISDAFLNLFPSSKLPAFIHKHSLMLDELARNLLPKLTSYFLPTIPKFIHKFIF